MTKDEALKLALEALKDALDKPMWNRVQIEAAITAIKQALAAPVQEPVAVDCCANCLRPEREHQDGKCPKPFTTVWHAWDYDFPPDAQPAAQPAPVQEPVAWMHTMIDDVVVGHRPADLNVHPDRWMPLYKDPTPCQTCQALARTVMMDQTAHDTTPPAAQRQWVGLTDEEEVELWESTDSDWELMKRTEAKLKEKNT
jgi:hypothetical protein